MIKKKYIIFIFLAIIFLFSFHLEYICNENNLYFRLWLHLAIIYYRFAFLFMSLTLLPIILVFKNCSRWLLLLVVPIEICVSFIFLLAISMNKTFHTKAYYLELKGKNVIAMERNIDGDVTTIYYLPVNIFFMEMSEDFPYPYEP